MKKQITSVVTLALFESGEATSPNRQAEIDMLRAFAILAVVFIHTQSTALNSLKITPRDLEIALVFDQFARFSVPLFVAASGYLLAKKYQGRPLNLKEFAKRRIARLLPPFLWASAGIYIYIYIATLEPQEPFSLTKILLFGHADYHLYFVPMIISLYILFPLILKAFKKSPAITLITALLIQFSVYVVTTLQISSVIKLPFDWGDQQQYWFFGTWIFYFVLGIYIAAKEEIFSQNWVKTASFLLLIASFLLVCYDAYSLFLKTSNIALAARFTKISILFYATSFIVYALANRDLLLKLPRHLIRFLAITGQRSYIIYLIHTVIIRIVFEKYRPQTPYDFVLFFLMVLGFTLLATDFFHLSSETVRGLFKRSATSS